MTPFQNLLNTHRDRINSIPVETLYFTGCRTLIMCDDVTLAEDFLRHKLGGMDFENSDVVHVAEEAKIDELFLSDRADFVITHLPKMIERVKEFFDYLVIFSDTDGVIGLDVTRDNHVEYPG